MNILFIPQALINGTKTIIGSVIMCALFNQGLNYWWVVEKKNNPESTLCLGLTYLTGRNHKDPESLEERLGKKIDELDKRIMQANGASSSVSSSANKPTIPLHQSTTKRRL